MRSPNCQGGSINFQFKGIIDVSSYGRFRPFGTNTSGPEEHNVMNIRSKHFISGFLQVILSDVTLISTPLIPGLNIHPLKEQCATLQGIAT